MNSDMTEGTRFPEGQPILRLLSSLVRQCGDQARTEFASCLDELLPDDPCDVECEADTKELDARSRPVAACLTPLVDGASLFARAAGFRNPT